MRYIPLVAGAALVTAIVALLSSYTITAGSLPAEAQPPPIGILQMMQDAKDLPVQQFDAI